MFDFFLSSYRKGILTFCGSHVNVNFDVNGDDGKYCFKSFENGVYKHTIPTSRHSNILRGVIIGKKSWGLWCEQFSQGIVDWCFTQEEIIEEFTKLGIEIPEPLMKEWNKLINKKKNERNEKYKSEL